MLLEKEAREGPIRNEGILQMLKISRKNRVLRRRKIDYQKIARAQGILRRKRRKPVRLQRALRDEWK